MTIDPTPATGSRADNRVLLARAAGLGLLGATAVVSLIATNLIGVVVLGAALVWLGVAVARRELRIRRRLADTAGTRSIQPEQHARPLPAPPRPATAPTAPHPGGIR